VFQERHLIDILCPKDAEIL